MLLLLLSTLLPAFTASFAEDAACPQIVIEGSQNCQSLKIHFDLTKCGDTKPLPAKAASCKADSEEITVTAKRKKKRYSAKLKASRWGPNYNWQLDGKIEQSEVIEPAHVYTAAEVSAVTASTESPHLQVKAKETPSPSPAPSPVANTVEKKTVPENAAVASPTPGLPLSMSGIIQLRAEGDDYTDFTNTRDFFLLRIRPQFKYQADEQVQVVFEPQFAKFLGDRTFTTNLTTLNQRTSGVSYDSSVGFHQGYILYHPVDALEFTLGRQTLSYGEELVIGAANWGLIGRSFDALKVKYTYGFGSTDFFYSKLADTDITASGVGDADFYGLYNSWDLGAGLRSTDLYVLHSNDSSTNARLTIETVGVRLKSDLKNTFLPEALDYRVEATKQYGTAVANGDGAYQVDAEVGYTVHSKSKSRLMFGYAVAGENYEQLFPSPHRWFGYADMFGRRNIVDWVVRASSQVGDLSGSIDFHKFFRQSTSQPLYRTSGAAFPTSTQTSTSNDVGTEWDLILKYKLTKTLSVSGGASLISAGEYLTDLYSVKPAYYYLMLDIKF